MTGISRRYTLATVAGAGVGILTGTFPAAVADAQLAADIVVIDGQRAPSDGEVNQVTVKIESLREPGSETIEPVPSIWGVNKETQIAWVPVEGDMPEIPPGQSATVTLTPPRNSDAVPLVADMPAVVRVYDKGTIRRADERFIPVEVMRP